MRVVFALDEGDKTEAKRETRSSTILQGIRH